MSPDRWIPPIVGALIVCVLALTVGFKDDSAGGTGKRGKPASEPRVFTKNDGNRPLCDSATGGMRQTTVVFGDRRRSVCVVDDESTGQLRLEGRDAFIQGFLVYPTLPLPRYSEGQITCRFTDHDTKRSLGVVDVRGADHRTRLRIAVGRVRRADITCEDASGDTPADGTPAFLDTTIRVHPK